MSEKPFYVQEAYLGLLTDPLIDGTELAGGHIANGMNGLALLTSRISAAIANPSVGGPKELLSLWHDKDVAVLNNIVEKLKEGGGIAVAAAKAEKIEQVVAILGEWREKLDSIDIGNYLLAPSGWSGLNTQGSIVFIVERSGETVFSFVVCTSGPGLEYHPSCAVDATSSAKLRFQTCIRIDGIPAERAKDLGFWSTIFTVANQQSEFHRVEVIYDCLLPWLAEIDAAGASRTFGQALLHSSPPLATDPGLCWRTAQRSNTSSARSVLEAVYYLMRRAGINRDQLKQFSFVLRREALCRAAEDLVVSGRASPNLALDCEAVLRAGVTVPEGLKLSQIQEAIARIPGAKLLDPTGATVGFDALAGQTVYGLYFSGSWCPPCKAFTPILSALYTSLKEQGKKFEVIFVSSDRSAEEFEAYRSKMPWYSLPLSFGPPISKLLKISGIPTLILFDANGEMMTSEGREIVSKDPAGDKFPWGASGSSLGVSHRELVRIGVERVSLCAVKESEAKRLTTTGLFEVHRLVQSIDALANAMRQQDAENLPPELDIQPRVNPIPFPRFELCRPQDVEKYAGQEMEVQPPPLTDLTKIYGRPRTLKEVLATLVTLDTTCKDLLTRARESTTASRLCIFYTISSLISSTFTEVIPIPLPLDHESASSCVWAPGFLPEASATNTDLQKLCLEKIHRLMLTYATVWQAFETPTRAESSERALVGACMLAVFDRTLRTLHPGAENLIVSDMLWEGSGYALSTTVCKNNRSFEVASRDMELVKPQLGRARGKVIGYFASLERRCKSKLFVLRCPDKIEMKKYEPTFMFMRELMVRCGYELFPPRGPMPPPSEIEALCNWLFTPESKLNEEHPEFMWTRDICCTYKFLFSMEPKETELLKKRKAPERYLNWRLTFEEGAAAGFRTGGIAVIQPLQWEVANFRGPDLDTADIIVLAFGGREISYEDGAIVESPSSLQRILKIQNPTEDDVLHCDKIPTYGDTLSKDESELLLSFLTVPYARIPLVLDFFASHDRATYLFNPQLQLLLRSVLFEPGPWAAATAPPVITNVPLRKSRAQHQEAETDRLFYANLGAAEDEGLLGTLNGLLVNELRCSPAATFNPILTILSSAEDIKHSSVYSPDATYICFLFELLIDFETYVNHCLSERVWEDQRGAVLAPEVAAEYRQRLLAYKLNLALPLLDRWISEAERVEDFETGCVVHTLKALLWSNIAEKDLSPNIVTSILGSIGYVKNWHGFGLGQNRRDLLLRDGDESLSAEQRLLRFLQSQGIDTTHMPANALEKYLTTSKRRRPLFLKIGRDTIRVPTLQRCHSNDHDGENSDENSVKLPPTDLPEAKLFTFIQRIRRPLVAWFEKIGGGALDATLNGVVRTALRIPDFSFSGWERNATGPGRYVARSADLQFDVQTGESLWRNVELKPVPDSMTQFPEYETIFGREALHCGLVKRTSHKHWVHVAGTNFDLIEWDEPIPGDQGVGIPSVPPAPKVEPPPCIHCAQTTAGCWPCAECTVMNCVVVSGGAPGRTCPVCGALRVAREETGESGGDDGPPGLREHMERMGMGGMGIFGGGGGMMDSRKKPRTAVKTDDVVFLGQRFNRIFDLYSEEPHPHASEKWIIDILNPVLLAIYPPQPPDKQMPYKLLFPTDPYPADCTEARLIGCDAADKENATWKEFVLLRNRSVLHVYNLLSHGRRIFRSLIFSSNTRFSVHGLAPNPTAARAASIPEVIRHAAGDVKKTRVHTTSLVILRRNTELAGEEAYIPPVLLQGVVPSCLLESFHFWQGSDGIFRGEPTDNESQWFSYKVEVSLRGHSAADPESQKWNGTIRRKPLESGYTKISSVELKGGHLERGDIARTELPKAPSAAELDPEIESKAMQLMEIGGFSLVSCRVALQKTRGVISNAAEWLFDPANRPAILAAELEVEVAQPVFTELQRGESFESADDPMTMSPSKDVLTRSASQISEGLGFKGPKSNSNLIGKRDLLVEEDGVGQLSAEYALTLYGGNIALARGWLKDAANSDLCERIERGEIISDDMDASEGNMSPGVHRAKTIHDVGGADLILLDLVSATAENDPTLFRLATLLSRIEDLSHILVWAPASAEGLDSGETCALSLIELPRLKVRFQPERDMSDGSIRLAIVDQPGCFISDRHHHVHRRKVDAMSDEATDANELVFLRQLLSGIDQSLIIEDQAEQLSLFVANHDVFRPRVKGEPFSTQLVCDRGSMGASEVMETLFYMYPIHPSGTMMTAKSLASRLYLALLRFMNRDYVSAFTIIEACGVDTLFTGEEQWIFNQFSQTLDDAHPDAHACRLKLTLGIQYSPNLPKWEVHAEMDSYLAKHSHVSAACLLSAEEELDILHLCKAGTPRIKNRLSLLKASVSGSASSVPQTSLQPRTAGQPWAKLCLTKADYVMTHSSPVTRLQYVRQQTSADFSGKPLLADEQCVNIIWEAALLSDEETGSNSKLGFMFLYDILTNHLALSIRGRDCSQSLGEIMARWFHLKIDRWGREVVEEGETDPTPSRCLAIICELLADPSRRWPTIPADRGSVHALEKGQLLYGNQAGRSNPLKIFMDNVEAEFKAASAGMPHDARAERIRETTAVLRSSPLSPTTSVALAVKLSHNNSTVSSDSAKERPIASNSSCESRKFEPVVFKTSSTAAAAPPSKRMHGSVVKIEDLPVSTADVTSLSNLPLSPLDLDKFVRMESQYPDGVPATLPFDLHGHPACKSAVAEDLLSRLEADVRGYSEMCRTALVPRLVRLSDADIDLAIADPSSAVVADATASLEDLCGKLREIADAESKWVRTAAIECSNRANFVATASSPSEADVARTRWLLRRLGRQRAQIQVETLSSYLISSTGADDLLRVNPYLVNASALLDLAAVTALRSCRLFHALQALVLARALQAQLQQLAARHQPLSRVPSNLTRTASATGSSSAMLTERLRQQAHNLAEIITTARHYFAAGEASSATFTYDPRFLVVEFLFTITLRKRQVEMVRWFVENQRQGLSRVQQMIMGAGKTTVVAPLLALILADGNSLVTQIMPSVLLEQTRNIMRNSFSAGIVKQIHTLNFDRSVDENPDVVLSLVSKLDSVRRHRGIVCAPPEAVKSLMLKFVEQLHSLELTDPRELVPSESDRATREVARVTDALVAKSGMADALVRVMDLWHNGVLIMDEVDVLLHPLRSELNFPIGSKKPIDLSGPRWELPMFLLDAIFHHTFGRSSVSLTSTGEWDLSRTASLTASPTPHSTSDPSPSDPTTPILRALGEVLRRAADAKAIQQQPHLVLLDQNFYHTEIRPVMTKWAILWLRSSFVGIVGFSDDEISEYISETRSEALAEAVASKSLADNVKLLNLARDWLGSYLPHVLSKINRVSYGLLTGADLAAAQSDAKTPHSRLLTAVPFVGKDVPSRASEFAHPDILIGLTILSYRYEGLRKSDLGAVVRQLKQDFSRQVGPREKRPASIIFLKWLSLTKRVEGVTEGVGTPSKHEATQIEINNDSVLPLYLFQPNDPAQMDALFSRLKRLPELAHYILSQQVFPTTMNFQILKVSACGHELASDILFKSRIGFSGTPSNILPIDLGDCSYEPGSDGKVIHVLTDPNVVSSTVKSNWTATSLLEDIATASPPVHALIDTGAFITNMNNDEVAAFLLKRLPDWMEGVVYLDRSDRQMILLRSGRNMQLSQCGISPNRRFTFYDQVHTTGMDIKQAPNARAVITIGKDMTFRDYAQGAYRMRGIGKGQKLHLFIIPEVQSRIDQELAPSLSPLSPSLSRSASSGRSELDVPAWLLLNSMRTESLQFVKMSMQELANVWRKVALRALTREAREKESGSNIEDRLARFIIGDGLWLRQCIKIFREEISYDISTVVPVVTPLDEKLRALAADHSNFIGSPQDAEIIEAVLQKVAQVGASADVGEERGFETEVVNEQEQQQQQQQEQEAEEEEQKVSAMNRDDEQANPWLADLLSRTPTGVLGDEAFYRLSDFHLREDHPRMPFPSRLMLSDNFFRPRWVGTGDRRLKTSSLLLELAPAVGKIRAQSRVKCWVGHLFKQLTQGCGDASCTHARCASNPTNTLPTPTPTPNQIAVAALAAISAVNPGVSAVASGLFCPRNVPSVSEETAIARTVGPDGRYFIALSLAEGETLRWMIHTGQPVSHLSGLATWTVSGGAVLDVSPGYKTVDSTDEAVSTLMLCLRFFNSDMYYTERELQTLESVLAEVGMEERRSFFDDCLRVRRHVRNLWIDAPIAKLFTPQSEWHLNRQKALLARLVKSLRIFAKIQSPSAVISAADLDNDGVLSLVELENAFKSMRLGFSPKDLQTLCRFLDTDRRGSLRIDPDLIQVLDLPGAEGVHADALKAAEIDKMAAAAARSLSQGTWLCGKCTFVNRAGSQSCQMCSCNWMGRLTCPPDKWVCGGCTLFNPKTNYYCETCNRANPNLASVRF